MTLIGENVENAPYLKLRRYLPLLVVPSGKIVNPGI